VPAPMPEPVLVALCLSLGACGAAAPLPASPSMPARLASTVHRMEEQGIDYSGVGTSRFELTLDASGAGVATRSSRGTDVRYRARLREAEWSPSGILP